MGELTIISIIINAVLAIVITYASSHYNVLKVKLKEISNFISVLSQSLQDNVVTEEELSKIIKIYNEIFKK